MTIKLLIAVYLITIIVTFGALPIIGLYVGGIEGFKEMLSNIKDKVFLKKVVIPVFVLITFALLMGNLMSNLIITSL